MTSRDFAIVDASFRGDSGHHDAFNGALIELAGAADRRPVLACNVDHRNSASGPSDVEVQRVLSHSIYTGADTTDPDRLVALNRAALEDFRRVEIEADDTVIAVHSTKETDIVGLATWLDEVTADGVRAVVGLLFPPFIGPLSAPAAAVSAGAYRRALDKMSENPNVEYGTFGPALAETFHRFTGTPTTILPHLAPEAEQTVSRSATPRTAVLYLGDGRADKGLHLLPEAARLVLDRLGDVELVVHIAGGYAAQYQRFADEVEQIAASDARLRVLRGRLSETDYADIWADAAVIAQFYDARVYGRQTSGVAWEALRYGVPCVLAPELWHRREFDAYGHPYVEAKSYWPESLADAIVTALGSTTAQEQGTASAAAFATRNEAQRFLAPLESPHACARVGASDIEPESTPDDARFDAAFAKAGL